MNAFKRRCIALRNEDYTLDEIAKLTGRPRTSVHFHIRSIPLSPDKRSAITRDSAKRIAEVTRTRVIKNLRLFSNFVSWDKSIVSLIAHLIFDGEIIRSVCAYNNRSQSLIDHVVDQMKMIYSYPPARHINAQTGVVRIAYYNAALARYLKEKSSELLAGIQTMDKELKREFVRAFFDDEGCIDYRPKRNTRRIRGYQKDVRILELIKRVLRDFDIDSFIQKPNEVVISGKENLIKFQRDVNFSPGVCINGNRSNSIWKKSYEKRDLLARAIVSYQT